MKIRVRLAPSPTGKLHLGTARTAFFNFLFARRNNGKFILRLEDTDLERSKKEFEDDILNGLKWLGLSFDEEISRQSERLKIYQQYLEELKSKDLVYECFCTEAELEKEREQMQKTGLTPQYSGRCKHLSEEEKEKLRQKIKPAFRLDVSKVVKTKKLKEVLSFDDLIRGKIEKNISEIGDFVIVKSDEMPVFFFAGVIDDHLMQISHIIRGEDHISNTFNQLLLFEALDFKKPKFCHLPLILEKDRSKMSKRKEGSSRVFDLRKAGYLAEAVNNFLALLGWSPKDNREFLSMNELIKSFDLAGIKLGGSIFDEEKLNYLNGLWIRNKNDEDLLKEFLSWLLWLKNQGEEHTYFLGAEKGFLLKTISVFKTRLVTFHDLLSAQYLFKKPDYDRGLLIFKKSDVEKTKKGLLAAKTVLEKISGEWGIAVIFGLLKNIVKKEKLSNGDVFWPLRVALSGASGSPSPQELAFVLGKDETLERIDLALEKMKS